MMFLITGRWLYVGFQMNQMNMTDRAYVFMLRISDPLQINQWGISGPKFVFINIMEMKFILSVY
jgi:hypothetical protein